MKKILLLTSKSICYNSTVSFIQNLKKAFEAMQYEVIVFSYKENDLSSLSTVSRQTFTAVIDFNSSLPCLCDKDKRPFLNSFHAPFFHYILDHPLYHHKALDVALNNYYVICLDRVHQAYIKAYYPHIKEVLFLPLFAICSKKELYDLRANYSKRPYPLLFTGTYTPLSVIEQLISKANPEMKKEFINLIDLRKSDLSLTMEEAMLRYTKQLGLTLTKEQFKSFLFAYYPVDVYMSSYVRNMVISYLLEHELTLYVAGHGWDTFSHKKKAFLHTLGEFSYETSLDLFDQAQLSLNIMPGFTDGSHDRVFNTMGHFSVSCTDQTKYLFDHFSDKKDILFYNLKDIKANDTTLSDTLFSITDQELFSIATNGYQAVTSTYQPIHAVKKIISLIDLLS